MITDTAQVEIVKQDELGRYDTSSAEVVYTCYIHGRHYVRFSNGKSVFLQEKSELTEPPAKERK